MKMLKNLQKMFSGRVLLLIGIIVVVIALGTYSMEKNVVGESMKSGNNVPSYPMNGNGNGNENDNGNGNGPSRQSVANPSVNMNGPNPANPVGLNAGPATVSGIATSQPNFSSCSQAPPMDPASLLPKDENSEWAKLNPRGQGNLENVNLLRSGHHIGIDTVGSSLRNANLQVRSEPPNPKLNVGPWYNTTIEPDLMRRPLEIDCGPKICNM